jgi:hypothetical protein
MEGAPRQQQLGEGADPEAGGGGGGQTPRGGGGDGAAAAARALLFGLWRRGVTRGGDGGISGTWSGSSGSVSSSRAVEAAAAAAAAGAGSSGQEDLPKQGLLGPRPKVRLVAHRYTGEELIAGETQPPSTSSRRPACARLVARPTRPA